MSLLSNRVALVTGGAGGIGLATAHRLAAEGADVLIADVDAAAAAGAAAEIAERSGRRALGLGVDVRSEADVQRAVDAAVSELGGLDVVVNNAGITRDATLRTLTLADWQAVIEVGLQGTMLVTRAASLVMRERKRGSIVNISSISGKVGMIGQVNYSAAKAGVVGLTKAAAKELAHHGVRVNAIQPGLVRTPMTEALRADIWEQKMSEIPMRRAAEPDEVANVVLFLGSDLSSYMTGAVLEVTGGRYM
jgi:3-oxoacyl-[acyl-carrier protein] reductase